MLIALYSDIHGNREALEVCLADAADAGAEAHVFLGDLVGYGPDPVWVVETVARLVIDGALAIQGNHDAAVEDVNFRMSALAQASIEWTRPQLGSLHHAFLKSLPLDFNEDDRLYVHASAAEPEEWDYILAPNNAQRSFRATAQRITICGHTHMPALFSEMSNALPYHHVPTPNRPLPLLPHRRWLAVLGAVGQPRDGNPAACYGLFDAASSRLTYRRVPYDVDLTARKIRAAGLPEALARRLVIGA
jgi:diadenosine tetraphosphatase ApaH/serine/threonine PP2A family protein phosphatase